MYEEFWILLQSIKYKLSPSYPLKVDKIKEDEITDYLKSEESRVCLPHQRGQLFESVSQTNQVFLS